MTRSDYQDLVSVSYILTNTKYVGRQRISSLTKISLFMASYIGVWILPRTPEIWCRGRPCEPGNYDDYRYKQGCIIKYEIMRICNCENMIIIYFSFSINEYVYSIILVLDVNYARCLTAGGICLTTYCSTLSRETERMTKEEPRTARTEG